MEEEEGGLTDLSVRAACCWECHRYIFVVRLACLSEFHDRGSRPQICCDHVCEPATRLRLGKREAGLAPCHLVTSSAPPCHPVTPVTSPTRPGLVCPVVGVLRLVMAARGAHSKTKTGQAGQDRPVLLCRQVPRFFFPGGAGSLVAQRAQQDSTMPPPLLRRRSAASSDGGVEAQRP